jgi:membrane associated rhomboid family serine protease
MNGHRDWGQSDDHQPVTWLNGYPVYAAHFIVLVFVVLMIVTALLGSANGFFSWLAFNSAAVWSGQVWRILTYGLFNPPSLSFAIDMVMLVWFGRELEKTFGRRTFSALYAGIYLLPPLVLTLIGLVRPLAYLGQPGTLALFVGFATLYPGAMMIFNILAKWAAIVLVGLSTLIAIADRNWIALTLLGSTCGYAHLFVRIQQGTLTLPRIRWRRRTPQLRVLPDPVPAKSTTSFKAPQPDANMAEIDALLDKIAQSGIGSLTAAERARLEAARHGLMKRGGGRG